MAHAPSIYLDWLKFRGSAQGFLSPADGGSSTHPSLYARELQEGRNLNVNNLLDTGVYVPSSGAGRGVGLSDGQ